MACKIPKLSPGFYWVRLFDEAEHESYWTIRLYDGWIWTSLGSEGEKTAPASLVWPIQPPAEEGRTVGMWENRPYGFYWMHCPDWDAGAPHMNQWTIAEFHGLGWRTIGSDEMWSDNDIGSRPVVGPIMLPWSR